MGTIASFGHLVLSLVWLSHITLSKKENSALVTGGPV